MQLTKLKGIGDLKNILTSNMEMPSSEFAGFCSYFGPAFPYYGPFPTFWNGNAYSVPCDLLFEFDFIRYNG